MIQIDVNGEELSRNRPMDVPMLADAKLAIEQLYDALEVSGMPRGDPGWLCEALVDRVRMFEEKSAQQTALVNPYRIGTELLKRIDSGTLLINDGAVILARMLGVLRFNYPGAYVDTYPLGSMGMGTPLAIGAAVAEQDLSAGQDRAPRKVILVTGDGSFGFYPSEIATAVIENLPITIIVSNNRSWGNELVMQPAVIGRTLNADLGDIDYAAIGRAMGLVSEIISSNDALPEALDAALASSRPSLLDVRVTEPLMEARELTILYSDVENTRARHFSDA